MIAQMIGAHKRELACPNMADTETGITGFLRHLRPQRPMLDTLSTLRDPVLDDRDGARLEDGLSMGLLALFRWRKWL